VLSTLWRYIEGTARRPDARRGEAVLAALDRMRRRPAPPAIVLPVHNAPRELAACAASLLANTPEPARIVLIDDASTDRGVAAIVARLEGARIEVHRNPKNLGFTRTANLGFALAGAADVALVNSDVEVGPGWLTNLGLAAYSGAHVGSATAFSDNAGAFSAPRFGAANPLPPGLDIAACARAVSRAAARSHPHVPTGGGFCLYVRRDCLDETGPFDAEAFPRGYGEENDFCMRARAAGWSHVVADAAYVAHARSASFGAEKDALLREGQRVLAARYPDYPRLVGRLSRDRALARARRRVGAALAAAAVAPPKPRRLAAGGGDAAHLGDAGEWETLFLLGDARGLSLSARPDGGGIIARVRCTAGGPQREAALAEWLVFQGVEAVTLGKADGDAALLARLCEALGIPVARA
jgi:GT2 family glycosyltransferase